MLKAPNAQLDQARDTWDEIRESFDESAARISVNRFLLHSWSRRGVRRGKGPLQAHQETDKGEQRAGVPRRAALRRRALSRGAGAVLPDVDKVSGTGQQVVVGRELVPTPAALAIRALGLAGIRREIDQAEGSSPGAFRVESFHFLATAVTNTPSSGGISRMYAVAARSVLRGETPLDKLAAIDELLDKLRDRKPTYAEFEAAFVELRSSRAYTQQTPLVRYILDRLHVTAPGFDARDADGSRSAHRRATSFLRGRTGRTLCPRAMRRESGT